MKRILVAILLCLIIAGTVGALMFFQRRLKEQEGQSETDQPTQSDQAQHSGIINVTRMYLHEIMVSTKQKMPPGEGWRRGVELVIEFDLEIPEGEIKGELWRFEARVGTYSPNEGYYGTYGTVQTYGDLEIKVGRGILLPTKCVLKWSPYFDDGRDFYDKRRVLPPLGISYKLKVLAEISWYKEGEWEKQIIEETFDLPVLNTLSLKTDPKLSDLPPAPDVYP